MKSNIKSKIWIIGWLIIVLCIMFPMGALVYKVDPFFHYHKPYTDTYYYELYNQRSQNAGIMKYFDYDALITGTSMTENFKTSELDEIFGVNSIKVPFEGGTFKELNDAIAYALEHNNNLKMVVRGLDTGKFFDEADLMRDDLGDYPTYLYDDNPFNDVKYLCNRDMIFTRSYGMEQGNDADLFVSGITHFDIYSRWQDWYSFGKNEFLPTISFDGAGEPIHLTEEESQIIFENITKNVTNLADEYPEVDFYYFYTPYSIIYYKSLVESGNIHRQIEAEEYVTELILQHSNIKLFSLNTVEAVVVDLNNYKDSIHYAEWINSYILRCMYDDKFRLTKDNYQEYIDKELKFFLDFDYNSLNEQEDYPDDEYIFCPEGF